MIAPVFSITSPIGARLYWHPELGHILVARAQMDRRSRHGRRHPRPDGRLRAYPGGEWIGRAWPLPGSNGTSDLTRLDLNLYSHRLGVAALFGLSSVGGFGGRSGHSMWGGVMILPYPLGWLMALLGGAIGLLRFFKAKASKAHS